MQSLKKREKKMNLHQMQVAEIAIGIKIKEQKRMALHKELKASFLLMNGKCEFEAFGKNLSESGQPQKSANSNSDSNSVFRITHLDW